MRKIATTLFVFTLLLGLFVSNVSGETTITYDTGNPNINLDSDVLYLNNYVHNSGDYDTGSGLYSIESDGDLTINLTGDNYIYGEGIYADGDISFEGSGTLFIENIEVYGNELTVNSSNITIDTTNGGYYSLPYITKPGSVYYDDSGSNIYLRYDISAGTYLSFIDDAELMPVILKSTHEQASLDNIYTSSPVLDNYSFQEYMNVDGLAYKDGDNTDSISYDASKLTYTIEYKDDTYNVNKTIRMVFNESELGKNISFKVLKASNIKDRDGINTINEGDILSPSDYIGQEESYVPTNPGITNSGAALLYFQNTSNDYYLKLEVLGANGTHRYININYVEEELHPVVNTGVKKQ